MHTWKMCIKTGGWKHNIESTPKQKEEQERIMVVQRTQTLLQLQEHFTSASNTDQGIFSSSSEYYLL